MIRERQFVQISFMILGKKQQRVPEFLLSSPDSALFFSKASTSSSSFSIYPLILCLSTQTLFKLCLLAMALPVENESTSWCFHLFNMMRKEETCTKAVQDMNQEKNGLNSLFLFPP